AWRPAAVRSGRRSWPRPAARSSRGSPARPTTSTRRRRRNKIAGLRARIQSLIERARKTLPARVLTAYGESQASNFALALAFAGFMSMFPIILGALSLIGLAIRDPQTQANFQSLILQVFPASVVTVRINAGAAFFQVKLVSTIIGFVAGAAVMVALVVALYRFVPNRTFRIREVLPGALLAGIAIEVLSLAFPLYAWIAH